MLSSCGGGSDPSLPSSTLFHGVAQKGPFNIGSSILIEKLNASGVATGENIKSEVSDKNGSFSYNLPNSWKVNGQFPTIQITANGKYFNESNGENSTSPISLTSIIDDPSKSSVNLLTDWAANRSKALQEKGSDLKQAIKTAKQELRKLFGIDNVHQLDISDGKKFLSDKAQLLLLSGALMEVANLREADPQTMINDIALDFSDDGKLSELGDEWFLRMQARVRQDPKLSLSQYLRNLKKELGVQSLSSDSLPDVITLASRPVANIPKVVFADPGETITIDGSGSHDSGSIINFTWFRIDQQTEYKDSVMVESDRFSEDLVLTAPNEETVLAAPNQVISLLYSLVVTDSEKLTHTALVKVIVGLPTANIPPIANSQLNLTTPEDTPLTITLTGSDSDNGPDPLTFVNLPLSLANGTLEQDPIDSSKVTFTPKKDFFTITNQVVTFTFKAFDGADQSELATIKIAVSPINDPPVAKDYTCTLKSTLKHTLNVSAFEFTDPEGDAITDYIINNPPLSSTPILLEDSPLFLVDGMLTALPVVIDPTPQFTTFEYTVKDENGAESNVAEVEVIFKP